MLFTDIHLDRLDGELAAASAFAAAPGSTSVRITFPIASKPDEYFKRLSLQFDGHRQIRCKDASGKFSAYRYDLLRRLAAAPTGIVDVPDLCEDDETHGFKALWDLNAVPVEGSLRNFASRINGDFAKYDMPWAVSYSAIHHCFILRFLPDPKVERKKYRLHLPTELFSRRSVSFRDIVLSTSHSCGELGGSTPGIYARE